MDILDDMGVSKLSAIFFLKVNYSFNVKVQLFKAFKQKITLYIVFNTEFVFTFTFLLVEACRSGGFRRSVEFHYTQF